MIVNCKRQLSPFIQREGTIATYFNEIRKYPVLSKNEQRKLLIKTKSSNFEVKQNAIKELVNANQRFVISAAMKITDGDDLLDLVNEGNIGLMIAIEKFDLNKNVGFITYAAFWVQKYMNQYITNYRNMVVPANANKLKIIVTKAKNNFFKKEERMPTLIELQSILKEEYNFNAQLADIETFQMVAIEENSEEDEIHNENITYTKATSSNNINEYINILDNKKIVNKLLSKLNEKDKKIISQVFGIGCFEQTYESIAEEQNLTKERIRQKVNEILSKLKKMTKNSNIFE